MGDLRLILAALAGLLATAGLALSCVSAQAAEPPTIVEEFVTNVGSGSATLNAQINPGGEETSYRFEYGAESADSPVPEGEGSIAEGTASVAVSVHIQQDLLPGTRYHFRVIATNPITSAVGEERSFITQPGGSAFALPDDRQWEMVSPANKHGAGIEVFAEGGSVTQAAEGGGAFTYAASGPIVSDPAGNRALEYTQVLSQRGPAGWSSEDLTPPHDEVSKLTIGEFAEYKLFSNDLSLGMLEPKGATPLPPLAEGAEKTIYLRDDMDGSYVPLVTAGNVAPGAKFGEEESGDLVAFVGGTADLSHVVFSSPEALTAGTEAGPRSLYEWTAGKLELVSVVPDGKSASEEGIQAELGDRSQIVRHAIASDGKRVVWGTKGGELYLSDPETGESVEIAASQAAFEDANSEDSKVFFADTEELTGDSRAEQDAPDLYVYEAPSGGGVRSGTLTDLTKDTNTESGGEPEKADVQGVVLGGSEDGSYVYFVANGVLAPGATPGDCEKHGSPEATCNLYVAHYDSASKAWAPAKFIASLSNADEPSWDGQSPTNLTGLTSEVSPNGQFLAFMSSMDLTGYDSTDVSQSTGKHSDEEVYLYDADSERLVCASCNPTGARPAGVFDPETGLLVDQPRSWAGHWLAGSVPGWTPVTSKRALYQARYLSNDGRLFFDGADSLVPAATNGKEDVYEYEPEGAGALDARCGRGANSTSDVFEEGAGVEDGAGACVALISSGSSSEESVFLDASGSGPGGEDAEDVFFLTTARLASGDDDSAFDVYDAHVCSAASPCLTPASSAPPPCSTVDSCRVAATPQPTIFGASGSATFSGTGNIEQAPKQAVAPKPLTRAQKLAKALKACGKKPKRKRTECDEQARARYGPKHTAKKTSRKGK